MRRACITCALRAPLADEMCIGCVEDLLEDQVANADASICAHRHVDAESFADDVVYLRMLRRSLLLMQHAGQISD